MDNRPVRNFTRIAVAIVVAAGVLATTALSYSSFETTVTKTVVTNASQTTAASTGTSTTTATSTTNSSEPIDCDNTTGSGTYSTPTNGGGIGLPLVVGTNLYLCQRVLAIPPGSNGTLVVSYQTDPGAVSPRGGSEIANFTASVVAPVYSQVLGQGLLGYANATGVTITPSVASVNVTGSAERFNVTYTISVSGGVQGLFALNYLDACPQMILLAIGYTASQLSVLSFLEHPPDEGNCGILGILPGGVLMSVSGIQMAWQIETIQPEQNGP